VPRPPRAIGDLSWQVVKAPSVPAMWALALGVVAWVGLVVWGNTNPFLHPVGGVVVFSFAIAGLILARVARGSHRRGERWRGRGMARAGVVLSCLTLLGLLTLALLSGSSEAL
jgi:hypothetical protein